MIDYKSIGFTVLLFLIAGVLAEAQTIPKPAIQKVDGNIDWVYDYEKGKEISLESGKPMFVVFRCER